MVRNHKRAVAGVTLTAVVAGALGVGVAAKFTESATTSTNHVTAATGKMTLGGDIKTGVVVTDIVPGDTITRTLTVTNSPDTAGKGYVWEATTLSLAFSSTAGANNNGEVPVAFDGGAHPLTLEIIDLGADGTLGTADDFSVSSTATAATLSGVNVMRSNKDRWLPNETRTYQVKLVFPTAATNEYEGASADFVYTVNATQRSGNEAGAFNNTPDLTSEVDNFDATANVHA